MKYVILTHLNNEQVCVCVGGGEGVRLGSILLKDPLEEACGHRASNQEPFGSDATASFSGLKKHPMTLAGQKGKLMERHLAWPENHFELAVGDSTGSTGSRRGRSGTLAGVGGGGSSQGGDVFSRLD